jgi:hypothetical protein
MTYPPEDDRRYAWAEYGRIVKRSWDSRNPLLTAALKLFRAAPLNQVSGVGRGDGQPDNTEVLLRPGLNDQGDERTTS